MTDITVDVAIIGAGTAGLYALREVRRAKKSFVLIDHGPLGTTCARLGCMPSKVALHTAETWKESRRFPGMGIKDTENLSTAHALAWASLREQRDRFAAGAAGKAIEAASAHLLSGNARFIAPGVLEVDDGNQLQIVRAAAIVIATGSSPVVPAWMSSLGDRVITTDQLFELESLPKSIAVLGLGAIGLEMGLALSRLGIKVTGIDMARTPAGITDPEVAAAAIAYFGREMEMWFGASAELKSAPSGIEVACQGKKLVVERALAALGRRPRLDGLDLAACGMILNERGLPTVDPATLQTNVPRVFLAGDANGDRSLMHEAADEGAIAGFNAASTSNTSFRRRTPLAIAFTRPDIATIGARFDQLDMRDVIIGTAHTAGNARSRVLHGEGGLLRVYADSTSGRLLGASILAIDGEHLAHLLAWAIARGETVQQLLEMPFYHPTVEEMLQSALQGAVRQLPERSQLPSGLVIENTAKP